MKIGDKIRHLLATNPQVIRNRATLKAIKYYQKSRPKEFYLTLRPHPRFVSISLKQKGSGFDNTIQSILLDALDEY